MNMTPTPDMWYQLKGYLLDQKRKYVEAMKNPSKDENDSDRCHSTSCLMVIDTVLTKMEMLETKFYYEQTKESTAPSSDDLVKLFAEACFGKPTE